MKRLFILSILPALAAGCLTACTNDPDHPVRGTVPVRVCLDWSKLAEGREKPDSMQLIFYGRETGRHTHFTIGGDTTLLLTCDDYDLLIFNNNSDVFGFRGLDSFQNAEAYILPEEQAKAAAQPGYIACADWLYVDAIEHVDVGKGNPVQLIPAAAVQELAVKIAVEGLDLAASLDARLAGAASGLYLHSKMASPAAPAMVRLNTASCEGGFSASTITLGCCAETPLMLQMRATLTDGSQKTAQVDISDISDQAGESSLQVNVGVNLNPELVFTAVIKSWEIGDQIYTELP